ncbi:putative reverse transcriptase domain-containing protein [Tanacetum coccineum]
MLPMMMTQSAVRPAAASRGGGTGGQAGRGGGRTRGHSSDQGDGKNNGLGGQVAQVSNQGRGQRIGRNQNGDAVNNHIRGDAGNALKAMTIWGVTGIILFVKVPHMVVIAEIARQETELWKHAMVGVGHAAYTDRFNELARLVPHLVTQKVRRLRGMCMALLHIFEEWWQQRSQRQQKVVQLASTLTDEALRNGSIKKNTEKRGNSGQPREVTRVRHPSVPPVAITIYLRHLIVVVLTVKRLGQFRDYRVVPRNVNPINTRNTVTRTCYECGSTDHIKSACPRLNQAQRPGGNQQNQVVAVNGGQGCGNQKNKARVRAFMLGAEEARQDPNIMTGTFTLNNHYATTLFDSGANYSFVSTTFLPLLDIEPSDLVFSMILRSSYGKLRMDWLPDHKADIICQEKVVRIPLLDGKVLRVLGEKPKEKRRQLMSANANKKKQEEIVVVRDFSEVFLDDLSGLPSVREIKFWIESFLEQRRMAKSSLSFGTFCIKRSCRDNSG